MSTDEQPLEVPVRGCGTRVKGGVYLTCGLSYDGLPIEHFLVDAPIPLAEKQRKDMGLTPRGVRLVENADPQRPPHVYDWVGSEYYPNVADFVEEVKRYGMSRRVPTNFDFSKLRPRSRQVLIHARAVINESAQYQLSRMGIEEGYKRCEKQLPEHTDLKYEGMCASLWWEDIEGGTPGPYAADWPRSVTRTMPAFSYTAWAKPYWAAPTYEVGVFLTLPIATIHVIRDDQTGKHEEALSKVRTAAIPYELRDE